MVTTLRCETYLVSIVPKSPTKSLEEFVDSFLPFKWGKYKWEWWNYDEAHFFPSFHVNIKVLVKITKEVPLGTKKLITCYLKKSRLFLVRVAQNGLSALSLSQKSKRFSFFESNPPTNRNSKQSLVKHPL